MTTARLQPADQIHFLRTGLTIVIDDSLSVPQYVTAHRGQTVTITRALIEANTDREGNSWLDLDADAQVARWGHVFFMPGAAPVGMTLWTPGTPEQGIARDNARAQAATLPLDEQTAAYAEIRRIFGSETTSKTLNEARS